jgi:hypothetical protein
VDEEFEIRVLSFSSNATRFHVSGAVVGDLSFQRITDFGARLYALKVKLGKGRKTIHISGDLNTTVTFSVGVRVESLPEFQLLDFRAWAVFGFFTFGCLFTLLIAVTICRRPSGLSHFQVIADSLTSGMALSWSTVFISIFCWPFIVGSIIHRLPLFARRFAVFIALGVFILPIAVTRLENELSIQTSFGYLTNGIFRYDVVAQMWGFFYNDCIGMIILVFMCLTAFRFSWWMVADFVAAFLQTSISVFYWRIFGAESVMRGTIFVVSPLFHVVPFCSVFVVVALMRHAKEKCD